MSQKNSIISRKRKAEDVAEPRSCKKARKSTVEKPIVENGQRKFAKNKEKKKKEETVKKQMAENGQIKLAKKTEKKSSKDLFPLRKVVEVSSNWKKLIESGEIVYKRKQESLHKNSTSVQSSPNTTTQNKSCDKDIWFDGVPKILLQKTAVCPDESTKNGTSVHLESSLVRTNSFEGVTRVVAVDCEMVGIGDDGKDSMVARVSIVNHFGCCIYDKYVKPTERVKDYRTFVSGIRPSDIKDGEDFKAVQKEVSDIFDGRILVGHALHNDLKVLLLTHPRKKIRDTSRYKPFRTLFGGLTPSLKKLSARLLGVEIQSGEHSSVQDAQAAMRLYTMHRKDWEKSLKRKTIKINKTSD